MHFISCSYVFLNVLNFERKIRSKGFHRSRFLLIFSCILLFKCLHVLMLKNFIFLIHLVHCCSTSIHLFSFLLGPPSEKPSLPWLVSFHRSVQAPLTEFLHHLCWYFCKHGCAEDGGCIFLTSSTNPDNLFESTVSENGLRTFLCGLSMYIYLYPTCFIV